MILKALVKIRRGKSWIIKPEAEALDGRQITVREGWVIEAEEFPHYAGETACLVEDPNAGIAWIASGDLEFLNE